MNRVITLFFATVLAAAAGSHTVPTTGVAATLTYNVVNNEVIIIDCNDDVSGELVIPSAIEGNNVTSIDDQAFYRCESLTSLTLSEGVTSIGDGAFESCSRLAGIKFDGDAPSIGIVNSIFSGLPQNFKVRVNQGATGFGESFGGFPVIYEELGITRSYWSGGEFVIKFSGDADEVQLESSFDLKNWTTAANVALAGYIFTIQTEGAPHSYYRLVIR